LCYAHITVDVDDPELCHDHSEIPDTWPPLSEILDYQSKVRARITEVIDSGAAYTNRKLGRSLWLAYEHEAMHLETFLYMLLQSEKVLPPPGEAVPDFKLLAKQARQSSSANEWHKIPAASIAVGMDDPENDLGPDRFFGWDNEKPARTVAVKAFEAQSRPISIGEYARFLETANIDSLPASWTTTKDSKPTANGLNGHDNHVNGHQKEEGYRVASGAFMEGKAVRTVYGAIPLEYVLDWPIMASYDELAAFAQWSDGRIPTFEEARSIYNYVDGMKLSAAKKQSGLISAVNG